MWNWDEYRNGAAVKKLEAELKAIDPELKIGGIGQRTAEGRVYTVDVSFPEKGHKKVIQRLIDKGYRKSYRGKRGKDYFGFCFWITMTKDVPWFDEEDDVE